MDGILSALLVIVRTPHIRQYLEQTEPKALEQALEAIEDLEADQQSRNSLVQESKSGAKGGIRTPTLLLTPAPQAGASASSATFARSEGAVLRRGPNGYCNSSRAKFFSPQFGRF